MSNIRPDEQVAFDIVGRLLGVEVEHYDCHGRTKAVDALLHYEDGRTAALEVSSLGPIVEAEISNVLYRDRAWRRRTDGLTRSWLATVPRTLRARQLAGIDRAFLRCEELGYEDLRKAADVDRLCGCLYRSGVRASTTGDSDAEGRPVAYVLLDFLGGASGGGAVELSAELAEALAGPRQQSKIDKLLESRFEERHLFLFVRSQAFSFAVSDLLASGGALPPNHRTCPAA